MKTIKNTLIWVAFATLPVCTDSCKKSDPPATPIKPTLSTSVATNITANSATGGGVLGDSSSLYKIMGRGVIYSNVITTPELGSPSTIQTYDNYNTGRHWGTYPSSLTSLTANTTYYVRAYCGYEVLGTNTQSLLYGEVRSFKTP